MMLDLETVRNIGKSVSTNGTSEQKEVKDSMFNISRIEYVREYNTVHSEDIQELYDKETGNYTCPFCSEKISKTHFIWHLKSKHGFIEDSNNPIKSRCNFLSSRLSKMEFPKCIVSECNNNCNQSRLFYSVGYFCPEHSKDRLVTQKYVFEHTKCYENMCDSRKSEEYRKNMSESVKIARVVHKDRFDRGTAIRWSVNYTEEEKRKKSEITKKLWKDGVYENNSEKVKSCFLNKSLQEKEDFYHSMRLGQPVSPNSEGKALFYIIKISDEYLKVGKTMYKSRILKQLKKYSGELLYLAIEDSKKVDYLEDICLQKTIDYSDCFNSSLVNKSETRFLPSFAKLLKVLEELKIQNLCNSDWEKLYNE